jgi:hypothetical protein
MDYMGMGLQGESGPGRGPSSPTLTETQKAALDHIKNQQQHLMDDARREFPKLAKHTPRPRMPDIPADASPERILTNIYRHSKGLVLGEAHDSVTATKFLIDNMPTLARLGVKTLYAEAFTQETDEASLKQFFSSKDAPTPEYLTYAFPTKDASPASHKYSVISLLDSARSHGIEVVPIDSMAAHTPWLGAKQPITSIDSDMDHRVTLMNQYAQTRINGRQHDASAGKWVAWVGAGHANTFTGIPGIAELTGTTGLQILEAPPGAKPGIQKHQPRPLEPGQPSGAPMITADFCLTVPPI